MTENKGIPTMPSTKTDKFELEGSVNKVPTINDPSKDVSNSLETPLISKKGIAVIATLPGFFMQQRREVGSKFNVPTFEKLGSWMKCEDPAMERKRVKFFNDKKKARK